MTLHLATTDPGLGEGALRKLIEPQLERWKVPGLEVVVVRGDEVLFAGGFGKANLANGTPVTEATLFHHGSTGKSITGLLAAILVDEGLLEWDRPVRDYVPEFRLYDSVLTERVTIRDLLAHRTGVARHELMWVANTSWDRAELVRRLRYLEPARDLRTEFLYWNQGYAAAGLVMGVVTGSTWEEQVRARVLEPLGMSSATTSVEEALESGNLARPYELKDGEVVDVGYRTIDAAAPAGQILYCALDTARWLRFEANEGEIDGLRLASEDAFKETWKVQMPVDLGGLVPDHPEWGPKWLGLGLGPALGTYRDRPMIYATGGIDGFRTALLVHPEDRIGILMSANLGSVLPLALTRHVADLLLGFEPRPWLDELHELEGKQREAVKAEAEEVKVVPGTSPSHPLQDYAGEYEHPGYGVLRVEASEDQLAIGLGELDFTTTYRHYDTWTSRYEPFEESFAMTFITDAEGVVAEVVSQLEPMAAPIRFARLATGGSSDDA